MIYLGLVDNMFITTILNLADDERGFIRKDIR
jgi:hypothetical protein